MHILEWRLFLIDLKEITSVYEGSIQGEGRGLIQGWRAMRAESTTSLKS